MIKPMNNVISMDKVFDYVSKDKSFIDKYGDFTLANFKNFQYEMMCLGYYDCIAIMNFIQDILDNCFIESEWKQLEAFCKTGYGTTIHLCTVELPSFDPPYEGNTMRNFIPLDLSFTIVPNRFDDDGKLIENQKIQFQVLSTLAHPKTVMKFTEEWTINQMLLNSMAIKELTRILSNPYNTAKLIKEFIAALNKCIISSLKHRGLYMLTNDNCGKRDGNIDDIVADYCRSNNLLFKPSAAFDTHLDMAIFRDNAMGMFKQKIWETQLRFDNNTFLKTRGGEKMEFVDGSERCEYCDHI